MATNLRTRTGAPAYPVQLDLHNKPCLVVGAGNVALRKAAGLLASGADVTVVGPRVHPDFSDLPVRIEQREYRSGEVRDYRLTITCTDDPLVNRDVYNDGEAAGVLVNSADDPVNCAFTLPSVHRQGDLTVTIATNGTSPALSQWLRLRFEGEFDNRWDELVDLLAETRAEVRDVFGTSEISGWIEALDAIQWPASSRSEAQALLRSHLGLDEMETA